jgi:ribosomal protein L2
MTVDHPHGGGRGKSKGNRIPVSPWGQPVRNYLAIVALEPIL